MPSGQYRDARVGIGGFFGSIVDTREKLEAFLADIDGDIGEGLATLERAEVRFYRSGRSE